MINIRNRIGIATLILMLLGLSAPALAKNKFEKEVEKERGAVKLSREVRCGGYGVITTEELKKRMDSGEDILIVDTMPYKASYRKRHIPGAEQFQFPIPEMTTWDEKETDGRARSDYEKLLGPDKDRVIVIYCGFVKCTRSHNGAMWAKRLGYRNVLRHPGGIYAWLGAGYPTESAR